MACTYSLSRKINALLRKSSENTADIEMIDASTLNERQKERLMSKHLRANFALQTEFNWIKTGTMLTWKEYLSFDKRRVRPEIVYIDSVEGVNFFQSKLPPTVTISAIERNRLSRQIDRFKELDSLLFEHNHKVIMEKIWGTEFKDFDFFITPGICCKHSFHVRVAYYRDFFDMEKRDVREFLRKHHSLRNYFKKKSSI
jgi:hypothetical protein